MLVGKSYNDFIPEFKNSVLERHETNDCVVRTTAVAFSIPYDEAHQIAKEKFDRENRNGVRFMILHLNDLVENGVEINGKKVYKIKSSELRYPGSAGYQKRQKEKGVTWNVKPYMTIKMIQEKYNTGTYFVLVRGHAFALVDGVVVGNFEDKIKTRTKVHGLYEIK